MSEEEKKPLAGQERQELLAERAYLNKAILEQSLALDKHVITISGAAFGVSFIFT